MERSTIVRVLEGLHARPATRFVKLAKSFESAIDLVKGDKSASAKSAVKLMLLGVKENDAVTVRAEGADAVEAVEMLIGYLENPNAGLEEDAGQHQATTEPTREAAVISAPANGALKGVAASEGVALGAAYPFFPEEIIFEDRKLAPHEIDAELTRFHDAVAMVQRRMDASLEADNLGPSDRGIITALKNIAADETLAHETLSLIRSGMDAVTAVTGAAAKLAGEFSAVDDPYLKARADDLQAVGRQLCLALLGREEASLESIPEGAILIADDIGAWDLARAPLKRIRGVICGHGGATSHVAIIARAHGIPAVLGLGNGIQQLRSLARVALDGGTGEVFPDPDEETTARFEARIRAEDEGRAALTAYRDVMPRRADGVVIEVAANIGSLEEIEAAKEAGAMGVGLFRTELLFMRHTHLPSEDMQADIYARLAEAFAPYPVIVRTLDVGGDKPVSGVEFPVEENPFLGWRGIRMCLDRPDIFKPQLRALLRAAVHGHVKVMLPMVSALSEVTRTKALIEECETELRAEGRDYRRFELGVMIETPAAVLIAPRLAKEVSFFSIGTNDLTQYVMAADRLNPTVAALNDVANPAVMAAIEMTAKAGVEAGIMVGMCGEAAGRPELIPEFIRMGLTELSMSPASIPRAKKCIAGLVMNS
ncbi:phosphoenolpyruvate--protein phosphotransferase [Brucella sp. IR073]|uniref:phosphoenolpyruvate--protein phosphotransferase n=1 Tax=unclassified Brucella TaxID=2632610 RepID=UPI003B981751